MDSTIAINTKNTGDVMENLSLDLNANINPNKCKRCAYCVRVTFRSGRKLHFCEQQKGGEYGKKIKANDPACNKFKKEYL